MNSVLDDVMQFGLQNLPADRHIGLTDGELTQSGDRWTAAWIYSLDTFGDDHQKR